MKIALVDDCQNELKKLINVLSSKLNTGDSSTYQLYAFHSGEEFLFSWKPGSFDLIILDIFMKTLTGLDVAREIRKTDKDVRIVFCTTSNEFAAESYEVNAQFYLKKPYTEELIDIMLSRLKLEDYELRRTVTLPDGQQIVLRNILYTEYFNHVLTIHSKKREDLRCYISQSAAEALLCSHPYFLVCSKGIIVNLYEVIAKSANSFILSNDSVLPISRRRSKEVQDAYAAFNFQKMREEVSF